MFPGDRRLAALSESSEGESWRERVFLLGIKPIIGGMPLEKAAVAVGWRFLVRDSSGEFAASHVKEPPPGGRPRLTSVSHGKRLEPYFVASERIEGIALGHTRTGLHQLRTLTIPCLLIEAFWLVPESGEGGFIVPFMSMIGEFANMPVLTVETFLEICRPLAEDRQAADDPHAPGLDMVTDGRRNERLLIDASPLAAPKNARKNTGNHGVGDFRLPIGKVSLRQFEQHQRGGAAAPALR